MSDLKISLTRQATRPGLLLPFHLIWFGRLSKVQGKIALQKGLIVPSSPNKPACSGHAMHLTSRALRALGDIFDPQEPDTPRYFAYLLREAGLITEDPFYIYANTPLDEAWGRNKNHG